MILSSLFATTSSNDVQLWKSRQKTKERKWLMEHQSSMVN